VSFCAYSVNSDTLLMPIYEDACIQFFLLTRLLNPSFLSYSLSLSVSTFHELPFWFQHYPITIILFSTSSCFLPLNQGESVARFLTRAAQSQDGQSPRTNRHNTKRTATAQQQEDEDKSLSAHAGATSSTTPGAGVRSSATNNTSSSSSSSGSGGDNAKENSRKESKSEQMKESSNDDMVVRSAVAETGMQVLLKMLILDNFVHADLHPGNVLIRMVTKERLVGK